MDTCGDQAIAPSPASHREPFPAWVKICGTGAARLLRVISFIKEGAPADFAGFLS